VSAAERRPVRAGIVGTGFAAASHADALRRVPGVILHGVAGSTPEKGRGAAERFGAERAYPDYAALLADPDIDSVHDCTPNHLHAEVNSAALAAGKHLLSEKPLGMDARQTADLARQAAGTQRVTGVCFNYRHYPLVEQARLLIAESETGAVHLVHGGYLQDWLLFADDWNWRLDPRLAGAARAVADIGSHWFDLVQHVTGDAIVAVLADLSTVHQKRWKDRGGADTFASPASLNRSDRDHVPVETDDAASILLRFASGARGSVIVSQVSAGWKNRLFFEVDAARASLAWDQEQPGHLRIGRRNRENADLVRDPALLRPAAAALAHYPGGHQEGWPDALRNLMDDFYRAVLAHDRGQAWEGSFATFASAHQVALLVEAVLHSHRSGRWAEVSQLSSEG
jgi:predicted dehydrogenase